MSFISGAALPALEASRCVHEALPKASCRSCVDACPRSAWTLDDTALNFDEQACDGCGLCVPACPQQAVRLPLTFEQRALSSAPALLARCEFSVGESAVGRVPCLHSIGLVELMRSWQRGQRAWLVMRGDCDHCERGQAERLDARIASLNAALVERRQAPILLRDLSASAWARLLDAPQAHSVEARRGFFGALGKRPVNALIKDSIVAPDDKPQAPGEWMPMPREGVLPWQVRLDATRCTGCHACARVCPQGAIAQDEGEAPAYRLLHQFCTGCGLCSDVCESSAVSPQPWSKAQADDVALQTHRCTACGVDFEMPVARGSVPLCWVCTRARPVRYKRQVMAN